MSGANISHDPLSAGPGGYGPPGGGGYGPPGGGGYGPPGGGGYGGPPPGGYGGGGFGPPPGGPPPGGFGGPGGFNGDRSFAEQKIKVPAILLLVFTAIGILVQLLSLGMNILGAGMNVANGSEASQLFSGAIGIAMNIVGLFAGGFCVFAFLKMMKLESRGMVYTAVIFSMLPCLGACWCINLWIGIWALVVLSDQAVKEAFR